MDIIASLASPSIASTQVGEVSAVSASGTDNPSFSQALSKASEPVAAQEPTPIKAPTVTVAQPPATPIKTPALSSTPQEGAVEVDPAPALPAIPEPTLETAIPEPVVQPKPAVAARPVAQLNQQAAVLEDTETDGDLTVDISPVSDELALDATDSTDDSDSALQDIRQRMDLIESAGQLDMASVIVVPPAPVQIIAAATGSGDVLDDAQQAPDDAATLLSIDPASPELASADLDAADEPVSTLLEPTNTVQTLAGSFVSTLQDQSKQSDSTLADGQADSSTSSDPQGGFNLAALNFNASSLAGNQTSSDESPLLSSTIGSSAWQDGLGQQVIDMFKRGEKQMDLRLHPADLGPLSISLNLSDSNTQAQFQSAHASVRAAVEQALPQLREALASQGITLGQASVGDDSSRSNGQPQRDTPAQSSGSLITGSDTPQAPEEPIVQSLPVSSGGVDLYL